MANAFIVAPEIFLPLSPWKRKITRERGNSANLSKKGETAPILAIKGNAITPLCEQEKRVYKWLCKAVSALAALAIRRPFIV